MRSIPATIPFWITIVFLILLAISLIAIAIPAFNSVALPIVPLCVYYLALLAVVTALDTRRELV